MQKNLLKTTANKFTVIDADNIRDDLVQNTSNDSDISHALALLRYLHMKKEIPYYELLRSKQTGTFRYLLVELNDHAGQVIITNLDTQESFHFSNPKETTTQNATTNNRTNAGDTLRQGGAAGASISCAAEVERVSSLLGRRVPGKSKPSDMEQKEAA